MAASLIVRNVRPWGGPLRDVMILDGKIAPDGASPPAGTPEEDGAGHILLPGLVEAHTHLDKTMLGMPWYRNEVGPRLIDKIDNERATKKALGIDPHRQSMRQAIRSVAKGSTHIRSHVDVDTEIGLEGIEGVMRTRDALRDHVFIEIVAFPQSGLLARPGTLELLEEAMRMGSEVVGGLDPCGIDSDPKGHLDAVFALCGRFGKPLDIHLHETGELGAFSTRLILERTRALGMRGNVTISHAFCLGHPDPALIDPLLDEIAALDVRIMTTGAPSRPVPAVAPLTRRGITVCAGNDGIRDTWSPYGNGDMLERAMIVGLRNNLRRDDEVELALRVCTEGGARTMDLPAYGLEPGCDADLVLVRGESVAEAVVDRAPRPLVVKSGRVVARDGRALAEAP
ncbi:amidohydrolase family protein [Muricoccus radiodurans]|uniref:amidohydrolase family protein n=1 Tax=Muricoccus radiodurans TaxID=2231721 RepID=UPI003CE9496A